MRFLRVPLLVLGIVVVIPIVKIGTETTAMTGIIYWPVMEWILIVGLGLGTLLTVANIAYAKLPTFCADCWRFLIRPALYRIKEKFE